MVIIASFFFYTLPLSFASLLNNGLLFYVLLQSCINYTICNYTIYTFLCLDSFAEHHILKFLCAVVRLLSLWFFLICEAFHSINIYLYTFICYNPLYCWQTYTFYISMSYRQWWFEHSCTSVLKTFPSLNKAGLQVCGKHTQTHTYTHRHTGIYFKELAPTIMKLASPRSAVRETGSRPKDLIMQLVSKDSLGAPG